MNEVISTKKLYLVVFLTGAIVMILELIGSRILAPSLGTSTFVWASLIGVILGAMSLGYYYGGRIADRNPNLRVFSFLIFTAGIFVFLIIIFRQGILDLSPFLGVKYGSLFASTLLFAAPAFLLGMVSPYAVRLDMEKVESSGRTVGNLYAVSTFGSIVGTFTAGFYFIPSFGNVNILYGLAFSLFIISFLCHRPEGKEKRGLFILAVFLTASSVSAEAMNGGRYLLHEESAYNTIRVFDTQKDGHPLRVMSVENNYDSGMYLDSDELAFEYSKYYALDEAFGGKIGKSAIFGGAAYSVPKDFLKRNTEGTIDVVEIDPKTTEVARQYFGLREDKRMKIFHEDARIFLNEKSKNSQGKYDVIYNDAFSSACAIPSHLTTREALLEVHAMLDEDGVYIVNLISSFTGKKSTFFRAEYKTMREVFAGIFVFDVRQSGSNSGNEEAAQNIMIVATKNVKDINVIIKKHPSGKIAELLKNHRSAQVKTDDVKILTDDFSPVSYYAAAVCDMR